MTPKSGFGLGSRIHEIGHDKDGKYGFQYRQSESRYFSGGCSLENYEKQEIFAEVEEPLDIYLEVEKSAFSFAFP